MRKIIFAWLIPLSLLVTPADAEPLVRLATSYYYIDGASATVLAAQLDQIGPIGLDGKHHAGRTRWDIQWKFRHRQQGTTCSIEEVVVAVGIAQTLPAWRGEDKGPAGLKEVWTRFMNALKRHEDAHKEHALKAGKEIEAVVLAAKPASNCEDLDATSNSAAQAVVAKYKVLDEEYDRKTDHGRNQGVTLL
jgi:predicted secreted Zn-dependent protease